MEAFTESLPQLSLQLANIASCAVVAEKSNPENDPHFYEWKIWIPILSSLLSIVSTIFVSAYYKYKGFQLLEVPTMKVLMEGTRIL